MCFAGSSEERRGGKRKSRSRAQNLYREVGHVRVFAQRMPPAHLPTRVMKGVLFQGENSSRLLFQYSTGTKR